MKKLGFFMALVVMVLILPGSSHSTPLNPVFFNPVIGFDDLGPGFGSSIGGVKFDFTTGKLTIDALVNFWDPLSGGDAGLKILDGRVDIDATGLTTTVGGATVQGDWTGGTLKVFDSDNVLALDATINLLAINALFGGLGFGGVLFDVTGGYLKPDFVTVAGGLDPAPGAGVLFQFFSAPTFSATTFNADWTSGIKGNIGATPEPGTVILLGFGLLGLGLFGRFRKKSNS